MKSRAHNALGLLYSLIYALVCLIGVVIHTISGAFLWLDTQWVRLAQWMSRAL